MLEECVVAATQIGFLFLEFFIPFAVAFWVVFGGTEPLEEDGSVEYMNFNDLVYQLWLLAFVSDYDYATLKLINPFQSQILVGLYVVVVSIITINIYIALLSEAFSRYTSTIPARGYIVTSLYGLAIKLVSRSPCLNKQYMLCIIEKNIFIVSTIFFNVRL